MTLVEALEWTAGSPVRGKPDLHRPGRRGRSAPGPVPGLDGVPVRVPGRDLLQGPSEPPSGLPGRGGCHQGWRPTSAAMSWGFNVGDSETGAFWTAFLRSLRLGPADGRSPGRSDPTNGSSANAATCSKTRWPCSPDRRKSRCDSHTHFARGRVSISQQVTTLERSLTPHRGTSQGSSRRG